MIEEEPSQRLVDQRMRNRVMEEVWDLSRGSECVWPTGAVEWFESFFDYFPYEGKPTYFPAMSVYEREALSSLCSLMQAALNDPSLKRAPSEEELVASKWPQRIAPVAKIVLKIMMKRGRFSEDEEEETPSGNDGWPFQTRSS